MGNNESLGSDWCILYTVLDGEFYRVEDGCGPWALGLFRSQTTLRFMLLLHWASIAIKDNIKKLRAPWHFDPPTASEQYCPAKQKVHVTFVSHGIPVV